MDIIQGERTIFRWKNGPDSDPSYEGKIEPSEEHDKDRWSGRRWYGGSTEHVVKKMNDELGEIPDYEYKVVENA